MAVFQISMVPDPFLRPSRSG